MMRAWIPPLVDTAMMKYVVAGCGYTGSRVLAALPQEHAFAIGRSRRAAPSGYSVVEADLDRALPEFPDLAADNVLLYTIPPSAEVPDRRLQALLAALEPPPRRIVYLSTSGVYGDRGGALCDESVPANPGNERSARRLAAEKLLQQFCSEEESELVVLRVPAIYGPGRLGIDRNRPRLPVLTEEDANPGNRIHVDDLARCCIAALDRTKPAGIYNVGDGDHRSSTWFAITAARLSGSPAPSQVSRGEAEERFSAGRLSFLNESRRLDNTRMREVLGVTPRDPETGIRDSL